MVWNVGKLIYRINKSQEVARRIHMAGLTATHAYPYPANPTRVKITRWLMRRFGDVFTAVFFKLTITGMEQIPLTGPTIALFNHLTSMDPPLLCYVIKKRDATPLGKIELTRDPFFSLVMWGWRAVPIRRGEVDRAALKEAISVIQSKDILAIAPEGHRNPGLRAPQEGTALLAKQTDAVIVPIGFSGTERPFKELRHLRRTPITISVGQPFKLNPTVTRKDYAKAADEMMYRIAPLIRPDLRGDYADLSKATMDTIELVEIPKPENHIS
jgi:1-acyl-sn-glycerol-3-phosphate acyltransferase